MRGGACSVRRRGACLFSPARCSRRRSVGRACLPRRLLPPRRHLDPASSPPVYPFAFQRRFRRPSARPRPAKLPYASQRRLAIHTLVPSLSTTLSRSRNTPSVPSSCRCRIQLFSPRSSQSRAPNQPRGLSGSRSTSSALPLPSFPSAANFLADEMADERDALHVLAQAAGRVSPAHPPALPTISHSLIAIGELERVRLGLQGQNPHSYTPQPLVVHGQLASSCQIAETHASPLQARLHSCSGLRRDRPKEDALVPN